MESPCARSIQEEGSEFAQEQRVICSDRSHSGSFLPIDPPFSEKATIGGIVAANSSGPRRLLYGLPRDLVLGIRFVSPTGDIVGAGGKTVKNVSGFEISKLMIGSMGSLGIICDITLRLLPLPENMETLVFTFESLSDASGFATALFATKLLPAAVEVGKGAALEGMDLRVDLKVSAGPFVVMVALEAFQEAVIRMRKELLIMAQHFRTKGHTHITEDGHRLFWLGVGEIRTTASRRFPSLVSLQINYPPSSWKALFEFADKTLTEHGLGHTLLCHMGNGVTLINLLLDAV